MNPSRPRLITNEDPEKHSVLIIDKQGLFGKMVAGKLCDQFSVALVSGDTRDINEQVSIINFGKKTPKIPDLNYPVILVFYQGDKITLDIFPALMKKAVDSGARLVFVSGIFEDEKKIAKALGANAGNCVRIIYGEIFDGGEYGTGLLKSYIESVREKGRLTVPGNGLHKTYPVSLSDIVNAVIAVAFTDSPGGQIYLAMPRHGFTQLAISRVFQKINPLIKVNFTGKKHNYKEYFHPAQGIHFFNDIDLYERLRSIDLKLSGKKPQAQKNRKIKMEMPQLRGKYLLLALILGAVIIPAVINYVLIFSGSYFLAESVKHIRSGKFESSLQYNNFSKISFVSALFIGQNMSGINPVLFYQKDTLTGQAAIGLSLTDILADLTEAFKILEEINAEKSLSPASDMALAISKAKNSLINLQKLKAENKLPSVINDKIEPFDHLLSVITNTIDVYPQLLGFDRKKTYLILFQNNMELRPGGGFIGSFATIDVREGVFGKMKILDVYDADGQLTEHIEPPFHLRRYLGSSHLFLRDSNYDVDFMENARRASRIFELEMKQKVDGVIAIDTDFVRALVGAFGHLEIHDYSETVTPDNFYLLTQTHAEKDFFPGSTQKKDFLRAVFNALDAKFAAGENMPYAELLKILNDAILQKNLIIALPDSRAEKIFIANNLSASPVDNRVGESNNIEDYLSIFDSNIGMNKSNYYLTRAIDHNVTLEQSGSISAKLDIRYDNRGDSNKPFAGDYKNFLRIILPANASFDKVEINGTQVSTVSAVIDPAEYTAPTFKPPSGIEIEKTQVMGKSVYGFVMTVPVMTSQKISVYYSVKNAFKSDSPMFSYDLLLFKQPGAGNSPYSLTVSYPQGFRVLGEAGSFSDLGGKIVYQEQFSRDLNINLKFSRK